MQGQDRAGYDRFATLFEGNARSLYYKSGRGSQINEAFGVALQEYPLGAGLGRYGQMRIYFGDETNKDSPAFWAEIQWPAWIFDGGVIVLGAYAAALLCAVMLEWGVALRATDSDLRALGALVLAANLGMLAFLFSYCPFLAPIGMQYWFLAGALHGVSGNLGDAEQSNK